MQRLKLSKQKANEIINNPEIKRIETSTNEYIQDGSLTLIATDKTWRKVIKLSEEEEKLNAKIGKLKTDKHNLIKQVHNIELSVENIEDEILKLENEKKKL